MSVSQAIRIHDAMVYNIILYIYNVIIRSTKGALSIKGYSCRGNFTEAFLSFGHRKAIRSYFDLDEIPSLTLNDAEIIFIYIEWFLNQKFSALYIFGLIMLELFSMAFVLKLKNSYIQNEFLTRKMLFLNFSQFFKLK